jgi:hypothetical protein
MTSPPEAVIQMRAKRLFLHILPLTVMYVLAVPHCSSSRLLGSIVLRIRQLSLSRESTE